MNEQQVNRTEARGLEIPKYGLSRLGRKAAKLIVKVMKEHELYDTGGCRAFYTPQDWKDRHESYGHGAELIVVHDGGAAAHWFNWDYESNKFVEIMFKELAKIEVHPEQCTSWYTAIYSHKNTESRI